MDFSDSTTRLYAGALVIALTSAFLLVQPTRMVRWLQRKNYQYEVTFALYMLSPTERFVFNSILFLTVSMLLIACTLYLPNHLLTVAQRSYYYFAGDAALLANSFQAAETFYGTASRAGDVMLDTASEWAQTAYEMARNKTVAAAQVAVSQAASVSSQAADTVAAQSANVLSSQAVEVVG